MGQINRLRAETISTYTRLFSDFIRVFFLKASPTPIKLIRTPNATPDSFMFSVRILPLLRTLLSLNPPTSY